MISRDVKFEEILKQDKRDVKNTVNIKINQVKEDSEESTSDEMEIEERNEPDVEEIEEEELSEEYADAEKEDGKEEEDLSRLRRSVRAKKPPSRYGDYVYLTYQQAVTGPDKENWRKAIREEKESLKKNKT